MCYDINMKINFISGATLYEATKNTIKQIDTAFAGQNLIVVPDSFSLQAENLVFDCLEISSTFNISVVGISRLASKILRDNNITYNRISGLEEILSIYQAVQINKENFKYFKNFGIDFCSKVLEIIKQFKNCKLKVDDITQPENVILGYKMHDLKLIYSSYEEILKDKLDLSKLLQFFLDSTETKIDLRNFRLYFVNFDAFSSEIYSFICSLAKKVDSISIGVAQPLAQGNAYIYENDAFEKMLNLARQQKIMAISKSYPTILTPAKKAVVMNVFSVRPTKVEEDYFTALSATDMYAEVDFVAKYITYQLRKGRRYKDFSIAVPDEKYFKEIARSFTEYSIPCYCDYNLTLKDVAFTQFILKIFDIAKSGVTKENLEYLLSSPFVNIENNQLIKLVQYYDISSFEDLEKHTHELDFIKHFLQNLSQIKTLQQGCAICKEFLENCKQPLENYLIKLESEGLVQKSSENKQSLQLITNALSQISEKDFAIDMLEFFNLIEIVFSSIKVETVPVYIDAVFVGDVTKSYFEDVDFLFILGSNQLPKIQKDCGLLTDEDIERLNYKIEPDIKEINRRNRLKLFEVLPHARKRLFASTIAGTVKPGFVQDLLQTFGQKELRISSMCKFNVPEEEILSRILFNIGCQAKASENFEMLNSLNAIPTKYLSTFKACIEQNNNFEYSYKNIEPIELQKYSASEMETFYACPFKHFMQYLLQVQERKVAKQDKRKLGIIKHALAKKFLEELICNANLDVDNFLQQSLKEECLKVLDNEIVEDRYFYKSLLSEMKIMLSNIKLEHKTSEFKPISLEKYISTKEHLVGVVDRVDEYKSYFRIIDYKTGHIGSIEKELEYGKKLQLFLYADAIKQENHKMCAGVYYFNCQAKPKKKDKKTKLLSGLTLKENEVVLASDWRLEEEGFSSNLIGGSRKKKPDENGFEYKNANFVTTHELEKFINYAKRMCNQAKLQIEEGYIETKPLKGECSFCPYSSICKYDLKNGVRNF